MNEKMLHGKSKNNNLIPVVKMKEIPFCDRPYEKMESAGETSLTDTELLSIIIKSGNRGVSAKMIAQKIMSLDVQNQGLSFLYNLPVEDLKKISGIGRVKAINIKAALEFGRRATRTKLNFNQTIIHHPADIYHYLKEEMRLLPCEEVRVVLLNTRNVVMRVTKSVVGSVNEAMFSPREIFKEALRYNAASIIIIHNHPSGNPAPSNSDIETTRHLITIGKQLGVSVLDHIIIGENGYESIFPVDPVGIFETSH
jgi:DNA repair protein RadC